MNFLSTRTANALMHFRLMVFAGLKREIAEWGMKSKQIGVGAKLEMASNGKGQDAAMQDLIII